MKWLAGFSACGMLEELSAACPPTSLEWFRFSHKDLLWLPTCLKPSLWSSQYELMISHPHPLIHNRWTDRDMDRAVCICMCWYMYLYFLVHWKQWHHSLEEHAWCLDRSECTTRMMKGPKAFFTSTLWDRYYHPYCCCCVDGKTEVICLGLGPTASNQNSGLLRIRTPQD